MTGDLLRRPAVVARVKPEDRVRVVEEPTRDEHVAAEVTTSLLRRPDVAFHAMSDGYPDYALGIEAARLLAAADCCEIEPGLSDTELQRIEREYGFEFADDHRAFLAAGLPVSEPPEEGATWENPWPNWRHGEPEAIRQCQRSRNSPPPA